MIFWFFGFPGIGKDFCAKRLKKLINAKYIHIDSFLTKQDKQKLIDGTFSTEDRLNKLKRTADYFKKVLKKNKHIVAADSLPDHQSRNFLYKNFQNNIVFILVKVSAEIHKRRIHERENHFFTEDMLAHWEKKHWVEPIKIPYLVLDNNKDGDKHIKLEVVKIYHQLSKNNLFGDNNNS